MDFMEQPIKEIIEQSSVGSFKVYIHINKTNNKKYIGITKQNIKYRWRSDGSGYIHSPHFYKSILKYGWDNFEHIVLHDNIDEKTAKLLEQYYIKYYNSKDKRYGYNMTDGGDGSFGIVVSEETRKKLSIAGKGKKRTAETKLKQSLAQLGKKPTPETLIKLSISHLGHKPNENQKNALKLGRISKLTPVYCVDNDGAIINFDSVKSAAAQLNLPILNKNFKNIAKNHYKCGGYYWFYKEK